MHYQYIYIVLACCLFFSACEKSEDFIPQLTTQEAAVYVECAYKEYGESSFVSLEMSTGATNDQLEYLFWQGNVYQDDTLSTLRLGFYPTNYYNGNLLFGFQFWSSELAGDRNWNEQEIEAFFTPGKSYEFGKGVGKVDVLLRQPNDNTYYHLLTQASNLPEPEGVLTIVSIEDYEYDTYGKISKKNFGKLVTCTFSGVLGRYVEGVALPVEVVDGIASFYVSYLEE